MAGDSNTFLKVRLGAAVPFADLSPQVISVEIRDEDRGSDEKWFNPENEGVHKYGP